MKSRRAPSTIDVNWRNTRFFRAWSAGIPIAPKDIEEVFTISTGVSRTWLLILFSAGLVFPNSPARANCAAEFAKLSGKVALGLTNSAIRGALLPVYALLNYGGHRGDNHTGSRSPGTTVARNLPSLLAYAAWVTAGFLLDPVYTTDEFEDDIRTFGDSVPEGIHVYVNINDPETEATHYNGNRREFERLKQDTPTLVYVEAESLADAIVKLGALASGDNKIASARFADHGSKGAFALADATSVAGWKNGGSFFVHRTRTDGSQWESFPTGFFAKNAQITIDACLVGQGEEGAAFVRTLGSKLLTDGGTIYAARLPVFNTDSIRFGFTYLWQPAQNYLVPGAHVFTDLLLQNDPGTSPGITWGERLSPRDERLLRVEIYPATAYEK